MGRPPRIQESELHYHVIVRCNNGDRHFETEEDFCRYLDVLHFFKKKHRFQLFNYELMHTHVHLFIQPSETVPLAKTMHLINWKYACDYNKRRKRKGHFWLDRYKSLPVESDKHALDLMRYINRNAVRASLVSRPGLWKWSGYRFYAHGEWNKLLTAHPTFLGLASSPEERRRTYVRYVNQILPELDRRRAEMSDARFLGSTKFGRQLGLIKSEVRPVVGF